MKWLFTALVACLLLSPIAVYAAGTGQVTCTASAGVLYSSPGYTVRSLIFQNQSGSSVYIAPRPDITTSNAGMVFNAGAGIALDGNANSWYCITASGTATVGYTEAQ